jgi:hypothetical protein
MQVLLFRPPDLGGSSAFLHSLNTKARPRAGSLQRLIVRASPTPKSPQKGIFRRSFDRKSNLAKEAGRGGGCARISKPTWSSLHVHRRLHFSLVKLKDGLEHSNHIRKTSLPILILYSQTSCRFIPPPSALRPSLSALRSPLTTPPPSIFQLLGYSILSSATLFYNMHPPDSCQEDQLNDPTKNPNALLFDEKGDANWYEIEGGNSHKSEDVTGPSNEKIEEPKKIKDLDVSAWLEETRQLTDEARGSYRLLVVENPWGHPTKFPMMKESLELMLCTWGFPPLHDLLHAIRHGGSAVFEAGSNGRRSMT